MESNLSINRCECDVVEPDRIFKLTVDLLMVVWASTMAKCVCAEAQMWSLTLSRFSPWGTKWRSYLIFLAAAQENSSTIGTWWNVTFLFFSFFFGFHLSSHRWYEERFESWAMTVALQGTLPKHHLEPEVFSGEGFWWHWPKKKKKKNL